MLCIQWHLYIRHHYVYCILFMHCSCVSIPWPWAADSKLSRASRAAGKEKKVSTLQPSQTCTHPLNSHHQTIVCFHKSSSVTAAGSIYKSCGHFSFSYPWLYKWHTILSLGPLNTSIASNKHTSAWESGLRSSSYAQSVRSIIYSSVNSILIKQCYIP